MIEKIKEALMKGRAPEVAQLVQQALDAGEPAAKILDDGLCAGMGELGEKFKRNQVFVPQVLLAARAMKQGMAVLKPKLVAAGVEPIATAVIGTIRGDMHDIGKNLVGMMLEGAGFKVIDAGIGVTAEKFISLAKENGAKIIGVSALLTTTMVNMREVVQAARAAGVNAKIIIGGAPVTQAFADQIGADGYSPDAASCAQLATQFVNGQTKDKEPPQQS